MPGGFGRPVTKSFWGDMQLRSGASLHARIIGSYNGDLLDDLLAELGPIAATDMIIVNFGAWYPAFAWQVCLQCVQCPSFLLFHADTGSCSWSSTQGCM